MAGAGVKKVTCLSVTQLSENEHIGKDVSQLFVHILVAVVSV